MQMDLNIPCQICSVTLTKGEIPPLRTRRDYQNRYEQGKGYWCSDIWIREPFLRVCFIPKRSERNICFMLGSAGTAVENYISCNYSLTGMKVIAVDFFV